MLLIPCLTSVAHYEIFVKGSDNIPYNEKANLQNTFHIFLKIPLDILSWVPKKHDWKWLEIGNAIVGVLFNCLMLHPETLIFIH